ncbi:MAG: HAD family phosphatase [Eubacteriales bacterium]|jgi:HAD superfamily hydrolase (TIGR01509 family)|nr:HAD family phosphatase [Eubacteriales bacterium]
MKIKGAIFDLDGTILDSMYVWHYADVVLLEECGIEVPPNLDDIFKTYSMNECVRYFIEVLGVQMTADEIKNRCLEIMRDFYRTKVCAKPYAKEFLDKLKSMGVKMCVATANDYDLTVEALEHVGLSDYFEFILTCADVDASKTDGKIYRVSGQRLGTKPYDTIVVEDALHGIISANEEGFITIGIYDESFKDEIEEIKKVSHIYADTFEDLLKEDIFK